MAKKNKNIYEVTKEKPAGSFGLLISGGASGTVFLFLVTLLLGAYSGMSLDNLIFVFLLSGFLGFFLGMGLTWIIIRYFGEVLNLSSLVEPAGLRKTEAPVPEPEMPDTTTEPVVSMEEEAKGKSVDYVFPEFSPENQS